MFPIEADDLTHRKRTGYVEGASMSNRKKTEAYHSGRKRIIRRRSGRRSQRGLLYERVDGHGLDTGDPRRVAPGAGPDRATGSTERARGGVELDERAL